MAGKIIKLSLKAIVSHKMRSFLTMLGIIIGVMAVVILVSITQGATTGITDSISSMGSQLISANITDDEAAVSAKEVEELAAYSYIDAVAPVITDNETVKKNSSKGNYSIVGVTPAYFEVQDIDIQRGRKIVASDDEWSTKVCVIGTDVATDLFGTWDAVDGTVIIGDGVYKVVGVLEEQGSSMSGSDDNKILIPYSTASKLTGEKNVSSFYIKAANEDSVDAAITVVESYLLQLTRDEDAYEVRNQSSVLDTMSDVRNTMSLLLAGIAAISLLVGGIGIMNIMLVSVSERTREIGIRKAVGAKRIHIMTQFLCEACILSVLGGIIGLALSLGAVQIYNLFSATAVAMDWTIGIIAIGFCAVIGVIFGGYPAAKASRLQPIDALHTT
jgi:putative ABC transport system permease protein